jgi:acyl carrier protein
MTLSELQQLCVSLNIQTAALVERNSSLDDQGVDSLDKASLIFEIEKRFSISIPDSEYDELKTPGDLLSRIP